MAVTESHWKERIAFIEKLGLCVGALQSLRFQVDEACRARIDKLLEDIGDISVWRREGEHAASVSSPTPATSVSVEEWTVKQIQGETVLAPPNKTNDGSDFYRVDYPEDLAKHINASLASLTAEVERLKR